MAQPCRSVPLRRAIVVLGLLLSVLRPAVAVNMIPESFAAVAKDVKPVVVNIFSTRVVRVQGSTGDPAEDFFRQFFGQGLPQRVQRQQSLGSGFLVSDDGYIVTNAHVVAQAAQIRVRLASRREHNARIVGTDPRTDLALLKIDAGEPLPAARLGDSEKLEVGDWVIAVGNPFGLASTVTAGIVSAKERVIGAGPYDDFIQTDASINPGNSGGPLLNLRGEVVGINSAIYSRSGGSVGIGFAIPINLARTIIDELRERGRVVRGWLGLSLQEMTPEIAASFGLDRPRGALVAEVDPRGPAGLGGIERGDVILAIQGQPLEESRQLPARIAALPVGSEAAITVLRNGRERVARITIGEQPGSGAAAAREPALRDPWGLRLAELTPETARRLDLPRGIEGAVVAEVSPGSPADEAGLQPGDVIRQVDRRSVNSARAAEAALAKAGPRVLLLLQRGSAVGYEVLEKGTGRGR